MFWPMRHLAFFLLNDLSKIAIEKVMFWIIWIAKIGKDAFIFILNSKFKKPLKS